MANTDDLRFVRTEAAIRSAFMELVGERPVDSITASEVCRRAGISRNAFYLHHSGVAELYAAMVDELLSDIRAACVASAERVAASGELDEELVPSGFTVLARHEGLLRALLPSDDGTLAKRLADGIADAYVDAALVLSEQGGSLEHRLRCAFSAWAFLGILQQWFELTDEQISDLLPYVSDFNAGIQAGATRFLTGGGATPSLEPFGL
ncbi:MAG: TetR family transcriptional regulator [Eggerthellaceae bacterium]|nr:TetR family transcriptional regulator [Eggerthellaceae bacterium]